MKQYKLLASITAFYVALQLVADITAGKLTQIGPLVFPVSIYWFPLTYILADVITEVYGYSKARRVVWTVLGCTILASVLYTIAVLLPPAESFANNDAFITVLGGVPRIVIGGMIATWAGAIMNDITLAKMKLWTKGKYLWTRTIGSTIVGEGVNTALFMIIVFTGVLPFEIIIVAILASWLIKVAIETILTPVTYFIINTVKRIEKEDYYDRNTNFNPFKII